MVFCKHCHKQLSVREAKFCPFCGKESPISNTGVSIFIFIMIAILSFFLISYVTNNIFYSGILGNFIEYSNADYNVTIDYPVTWEYKDDFDGNTVVAFRPPASEITITHDVGLSIYVDKLLFYIPLNRLEDNGTSSNSMLDISNSTSSNSMLDISNSTSSNSMLDISNSTSSNSMLDISNSTSSNSTKLSPADQAQENVFQENDLFLNNNLPQNNNLVLKVPWNLSLEEYTKYKIDALRIRYPDVKVTRTSLDGNNAFNVTYTFPDNNTKTKDKEFRATQIWTIKNDRAYIITYIVREDEYLDYIPILEKMINSFSIM